MNVDNDLVILIRYGHADVAQDCALTAAVQTGQINFRSIFGRFEESASC